MRDIDVMIAARSELAVLITATAPEQRLRWARFIHDNSNRRTGPFVALDCDGGVVTSFLLLRALNEASGGTLFVDGVGRLDRAMLRMLVNALAGSRGVRLISGATPSLWTCPDANSCDADLLYRLNVIHLMIDTTS